MESKKTDVTFLLVTDVKITSRCYLLVFDK